MGDKKMKEIFSVFSVFTVMKEKRRLSHRKLYPTAESGRGVQTKMRCHLKCEIKHFATYFDKK